MAFNPSTWRCERGARKGSRRMAAKKVVRSIDIAAPTKKPPGGRLEAGKAWVRSVGRILGLERQLGEVDGRRSRGRAVVDPEMRREECGGARQIAGQRP